MKPLWCIDKLHFRKWYTTAVILYNQFHLKSNSRVRSVTWLKNVVAIELMGACALKHVYLKYYVMLNHQFCMKISNIWVAPSLSLKKSNRRTCLGVADALAFWMTLIIGFVATTSYHNVAYDCTAQIFRQFNFFIQF